MKIAMFGATGMIGKPVAEQFIKDGHQLNLLTRKGEEHRIPPNHNNLIIGDLKNEDDIRKTIVGTEAIYMSLSVPQTSKEKDFQPEREGIDNILKIAKEENIKLIGYLSSLLQEYQGMNGFDWWVFKIKQRAYKKVKESSIPSIIFRPSSFMQNFTGSFRQGKSIALAGESKYPMYWIDAADYGKMVSSAFSQFERNNQEYVIQGTEAYNADDAAKIFVDNYQKEKLKISKAPLGMLKFMGSFVPKLRYVANIVEATNNYPEKFHGTEVWDKLGKPTITLKQFASSH